MQAHARRQTTSGTEIASPRRRALLGASVLMLLVLLVSGAATSATGATLNQPTTPILDDFNRVPNELPVSQGGNWGPTGFAGGPGAYLENQVLVRYPDVQDSSSYRQTVYSGDMEAYYTIAGPPSSSNGQYAFIALQDVGTAGWDGYAAILEATTNGSRVHLRRYDNGACDPASDHRLLRRRGQRRQIPAAPSRHYDRSLAPRQRRLDAQAESAEPDPVRRAGKDRRPLFGAWWERRE